MHGGVLKVERLNPTHMGGPSTFKLKVCDDGEQGKINGQYVSLY